ncbi:hypothetical protein [Kribbella sp. NPDC049584]|uniref:Mom family adenine methylcarbamoylation protein n=1 Tax=Kribbella sp. NPDC049584 TaxID=3154833 RepID=UPI0034302141
MTISQQVARTSAPASAKRQMPMRGQLTLDGCRANTPAFADEVKRIAGEYEVPVRALTVRSLLHLPLVTRSNGSIHRKDVVAELHRNASRLWGDYQAIEHLIPKDGYSLKDLRFMRLTDGIADEIFSRLHYLRSARAGSRNFALVDPVHQRPVTLCSVSPLEWALVSRQLRTQFDLPPGAAWDVSRVYSFDVAPPNAISFLLAKVRQAMRTVSNARVLTTAVDPNLGFVGASYRAANWHQWMSVQPRPYLYVDGRYTSPRQLRLRYGGANLAELSTANPGSRFEQSRVRLLDSWIFCCRLQEVTEAVPRDAQRCLRR